jgi:hypothetical protein
MDDTVTLMSIDVVVKGWIRSNESIHKGCAGWNRTMVQPRPHSVSPHLAIGWTVRIEQREDEHPRDWCDDADRQL